MLIFADAHTVRLLRSGGAVLTVCVCALPVAGGVWFGGWFFAAAGAVALAGGAFCLWYPPRFARSVQGYFDGKIVAVRMGVVWRRHLFVPRDALRNFEVWRPPLHRLCGCATLLLRFAGGTVVLPFLPCETAERLVHSLREGLW